MGNHVTNSLSYLIRVAEKYKSQLFLLRLWSDLEVAFQADFIWVQGFEEEELDQIEILSIPEVKRFHLKEDKLYPLGAILPYSSVPELEWQAIQQALPVSLPKLNFNFFGWHKTFPVALKPVSTPQKERAVLSSVEALEKYMVSAPAVRLQPISWVLLKENRVLLLGTPLLPVKGEVFWKRGNQYFPLGYQLENDLIADFLDRQLSDAGNSWVFWTENDSWFPVKKSDFKELSRSSFNNTFRQIQKQ